MLNLNVVCGGNGTRLWPLSRKLLPKSLNLTGELTMFQMTCKM